MAPELAWGAKNAKPPCDIFSLGVIAHELLLGKRPWTESPAFARLEGASVAPAEPLASLCPGLDPTLGDTLDSCLSSNPELRPSARELAAALRAGLHHAVRVGSVN
jgi:serine/threonine-protein kinase